MNKTLRSLFAHKSWANAELFVVLALLVENQSELLHTCLRTLHHAYIVDRIFRAHLAGEPRPFDATNAVGVPNLEVLANAVAELDNWYQEYVDQVSPEALSEVVDFTFTSGSPGRMSREEILLHLITHSVYHRGSVAQVLKSISVVPPDDPYTVFLHQVEPDRKVARGVS
jgi:uncharacterized damage-inducible protein DinB